MTEKQLLYRINRAEEALARESRKNTEKMSRVGWGSGFRKQYVGPSCSRELQLESRLRDYRNALDALRAEQAAAGEEAAV